MHQTQRSSSSLRTGINLSGWLAGVVVLWSVSLPAAVIQVPADAPTIQSAVVQAVDGDVIEIAPGTYFENIIVGDKSITIRGAGVDATTIDGSALNAGARFGSVIRFGPGRASTPVLEDLTITGGTGTLTQGLRYGGGVSARVLSLTTRRVRVLNNSAQFGGGIYVRSTDGGTLMDSQFVGNTTISRGGGAQLISDTAYTIERCVFEGNDGGDAGGGLAVLAPQTAVRSCTFRSNTAMVYGGGFLLLDIDAELPQSTVYDVEITDCHFEGNSAAFGGGISTTDALITVAESKFLSNLGGFGGAIEIGSGGLTLKDSLLVENVSDGGSVQYSFLTTSPMVIENATIVNEQTTVLFRSATTAIEVRRSIIRGTSHGPLSDGAPLSVEYSDVEGGAAGTGNFDADPLFVDPAGGDYRISPASPCVDAGGAAAPLDLDGTTADIGAFPVFQGEFRRGDANLDTVIDIADPLRVLTALFSEGGSLACPSAADANDDELVDLGDPIFLLNFLFQNGSSPTAPIQCGVDPTPGTFCDAAETGCP